MKQGRASTSSMNDEPPPKRRKNDTSETSTNGDLEHHHSVKVTCLEEHEASNGFSPSPSLVDSGTNTASPVVESERVVQTKGDSIQPDTGALEPNPSLATSALGLVVVAPEFPILHDSWNAFEEALKAYGRATYQLYVIRSTTSVKRRNLKITESRRKEPSMGASMSNLEHESNMVMASDPAVDGQIPEKTLIPGRFQWYSKSLKCTHGWKNRHRGTGKRGSGVVRSTSCPAKMCVTLQYRGPGPEDWKVVVTKHVRTHNHQLSKELYLYYTENRRIYDPDLLAVIQRTSGARKATGVDTNSAHAASMMEEATQQAGFDRIHSSKQDETHQQTSSIGLMMTSDASTSFSSFPNQNENENETVPDDPASKELLARSDANPPPSGHSVIQPCVHKSETSRPAMRAMILTPGTLPSKAIHGGGFCVPRVSTKVHASWDAFHDFIAQYAFDTAQVFRTRSTVSIAARNAKIVASLAAKSRPEDGETLTSPAKTTCSTSSSPSSSSSRLIPDKYKWFSKLLICTYGWKRRARGQDARKSDYNDDITPCPAMLLARMERNVDGGWHVVINRQVQKHNHRLSGSLNDTGEKSHASIESTSEATASTVLVNSALPSVESGEAASSLLETEETSVDESFSRPRDIVVRVPKLQSVFNSWEDFHASLKAYSDATFQLYRTRTTSSVQGRNRKIIHMKQSSVESEHEEHSDSISDPDALLHAARKIPESWRWYSKTLTCTHGWKERHRGTGKRSAHGVRSTACPVKICATVQYLNPASRHDRGSNAGDSSCRDSMTAGWRVVVTKHIVDHNHNLSRELYQHYCENRRIYDPELLTIDTSTNGSMGPNGIYHGSGVHSSASATSKPSIISVAGQAMSQPPPLPTQQEVEALTNVQFFGSSTNQPVVEGCNSGALSVPQATAEMVPSATLGGQQQHCGPSVALLPSTSTPCYLPVQVQRPKNHQPRQQQKDHHQQQTLLTFDTCKTLGDQEHAGGKSAVAFAPMATASMHSSPITMLQSTEMPMMNAVSSSSSNVISVACRIHSSSSGTTIARSQPGKNHTDSKTTSTTETTHCTCFRIAGGVSIVPAVSEPPAPPGTSCNVSTETTMYSEDLDGVWQPLSQCVIQQETLENGRVQWRVPRIVRRYPSWDAFHTYLDAYSAATFQLYRVRTTYSVRSRNIRLRQLAASRGLVVRETDKDDTTETAETEQEEGLLHGLSRAHLVPERYEWYSKTFLCTHGWKRRSRGNGQRVSHNVRATECPVKVCATLQRNEGSNEWSVVVTKHLTDHNHELSETLYLQYSEVRRVRDPEVLAKAEQLWRAGATRRRVFEFLKEHSPNQIIFMKDVHNLVQRWQTQERRLLQDHQQDNEYHPRPPQPQDTASDGPVTQDHESASWL